MNEQEPCCVLTINSGSSSLKFSVYEMGAAETLKFSGSVERIGLSASRFYARDADGKPLIDEHRELADHDAACGALLGWLKGQLPRTPVGSRGAPRRSRRPAIQATSSDYSGPAGGAADDRPSGPRALAARTSGDSRVGATVSDASASRLL